LKAFPISESFFGLASKSVAHLSYRKAIKVALNACSLKSIHRAFSLSTTELKPPSFYSARMGVSNGVSYEAQTSSQGINTTWNTQKKYKTRILFTYM